MHPTIDTAKLKQMDEGLHGSEWFNEPLASDPRPFAHRPHDENQFGIAIKTLM